MTDDGDAHAGTDDDALVVESLEGVGQPSRRARRRAGAEAERALWGRRLTWRQRSLRGALITMVVAVTLFALLGGPALTVKGWQRLTFALRSGTLAPKLEMTTWQRVPPPPGVAPDALSYATNPADPQTVLACLANAQGITLWRSDSLGASWIPIVVSHVPAQSCAVKSALDSSQRLALVARTPDPQRLGCETMAVYLSDFAGYQWVPAVTLPQATGQVVCHADAWVSAAWVYEWWTDSAIPEPSSNLMRSNDDGITWEAADGGLPARGAYLAPALTTYGSGLGLLAQVYYWPRHGRLNILRQVVRSDDGGAHWTTLSSGPPASLLAASMEPRIVSLGAWTAVYASTYTDGLLSPPWVPDQPPEGIRALSSLSGVWSELPPLPVSGATADDHLMGVDVTLGVAPANMLLTLGVDPHHQVSERVVPRDLWLWAWDPTSSEWRLGQQAPPNAQLVGFTWSAGPVGSAYEQDYGGYLWLTADDGGRRALYSAFIPAPTNH